MASRVVNFYGFDFAVTTDTLIPRPETEQLVERTSQLIPNLHLVSPRVVDVGTGSGAIAIVAKKLWPDTDVIATDLSKKALEVARSNAAAQAVTVTFLHSNLLAGLTGPIDIVIANLPYVPAARWPHLDASIRNLEPREAIVGGRDGLAYIRRLIDELPLKLSPVSLVALEVDDTHAGRVLKLLTTALPQHRCWVEQDLAGFDRFVFALKTESTKLNGDR